MRSSEDTSVYDKIVSAIFDDEAARMREHHHHSSGSKSAMSVESTVQFAEYATELRDNVIEVAREVFKQHCAKHLEIIPMRLMDDPPQIFRLFLSFPFITSVLYECLLIRLVLINICSNAIKLLTQGGDMLELCRELRLPFVAWAINCQVSHYCSH